MYGGVEAAPWSSANRLLPDAAVTLGTPINNTSLHVVDGQQQPVLPGVPGDLLIGQGEEQLVRTGDLARLRVDGEIELLGSKSLQALLRGQQIELSRIESLLRTHAEVNDAAVTLRDDFADEPGLVAYLFVNEDKLVSEDQQQTTRELRQTIRTRMPGYMVPARFVYLSEIPETPTGKLDRTALPTPPEQPRDAEEDFVAASTATQQALAEIWQDVLNIPQVGITENFFEIGGQSLKAVQVFARIESDLNRKLRWPPYSKRRRLSSFRQSSTATPMAARHSGKASSPFNRKAKSRHSS